MASEKTDAEEILALARAAGEYLSYLSELGVKTVEESVDALANAERPTARAEESPKIETDASKKIAALRRNADAAAKAEASLTEKQKGVSQHQEESERVAPAASVSLEQTEMAKRTTKKYPDEVPPPPQETLFGEITPADDESLPRADETLEDIWNDIGVCMRCPLCCEGRTHIVNSEGNRKARLMFVGEAPGADEDASGRPFVGRAGQLLNKIIEAIGMKREDVFIGNVNRCRPQGNRTP
ncbi:MAG: uracil-DNA glycosylase, partial [Pyrinomonadaceae bacterium]